MGGERRLAPIAAKGKSPIKRVTRDFRISRDDNARDKLAVRKSKGRNFASKGGFVRRRDSKGERGGSVSERRRNEPRALKGETRGAGRLKGRAIGSAGASNLRRGEGKGLVQKKISRAFDGARRDFGGAIRKEKQAERVPREEIMCLPG